VQSDSARVLPPQDDVRALLKSVFREDLAADGAFTAAGMAVSELVELYKLAQTAKDAPALEVGMANATSSIVICGALATRDKGHLTSIDPFQLSEYRNVGLANVARAGFAERHQLIDEPDYLALPRLVGEGRRFGFIFVDGWHSFDYAMLDIFFADLLLEDGGVLALHDTDWPPVYKAVRFLETHKPYDRLSPAPAVALDGLLPRVTRRVRTALEGRHAVSQAHARRTRWRSLSAYRKRNSQTTLQRLEAAF
jgi:predicted O-methyltransferase YrrM